VDLVLSKTDSPDPVVSGSTLTYQLGITNNKPNSGTAAGVVLTDPLPVGTTFVACFSSQGNCNGPAVGANGTVTANIGSVPSPGFALVTIVVTVTAPGGTSFNNTAVVTTTTPDTDLSNNTAQASTTVNSAPVGADLSVVKSAPSTVALNTDMVYSIAVHNGGPDLATGVLVSDSIPSGTTFVTCFSTLGTCTGPVVGTNGTVTANLGTMASSGLTADATITITVHVTPSAVSPLVNTAVVTATTTDPNPANNSSTAVTTIP
jgi:uncharacterized repeat protein (TIGR01451 family)